MHDDLRRPIPPRVADWRHWPSNNPILFLDPDAAGKPEIAKFDLALVVDEDVGRFDVSMDDVAVVQQAQRLQQVKGQDTHLILAQLRVALDQRLQVGRHVFHYEVEPGEVR